VTKDKLEVIKIEEGIPNNSNDAEKIKKGESSLGQSSTGMCACTKGCILF